MLAALFRAFAALPTPPLRRVVLLSLALALTSFTVLWFGAAVLLDHTAFFGWAALNWLVNILGYPGQVPARRAPIREILATTLRLMGLTILLNLLALPVYLLAPGINVLLFLGLNGYLFGREYFEVVALRRLDVAEARRMRQRFGARVFAGGVVIAALFALPLVNLVAPVIATAFMVHIFQELRRREPQFLAP